MLVPDLKVETPEERLFRLPRGSALVEMRPAGRPPSTASQAALFMAPHTSMQASPQRARTPPLCRPLPSGPTHLPSAGLSLMGPHTSSLQTSPWWAHTPPLCRPLPGGPAHLLSAGLSPGGHYTARWAPVHLVSAGLSPAGPGLLPDRPGEASVPGIPWCKTSLVAGPSAWAGEAALRQAHSGQPLRSCVLQERSLEKVRPGPALPVLPPWLSREHVLGERGDHRTLCRPPGAPLGGPPDSPRPGKSSSGVGAPAAASPCSHWAALPLPWSPLRSPAPNGRKEMLFAEKITATTKKAVLYAWSWREYVSSVLTTHTQ